MSEPKKVRFTQNRELSWLKFNERVLAESDDVTVPLFERLKFIAIFTSNLDEFYMIRVGSLNDLDLLKNPPVDNKSHMTPREQLDAIFDTCRLLYAERDDSFRRVEHELRAYDVCRYAYEDLDDEDRAFVDEYADNYVLPVLSPQIIDQLHPFPHLVNDKLYVAVSLRQRKGDEDILGVIPVPSMTKRVIYLPSKKFGYILVEDVIRARADEIFHMYKMHDRAIIKVTRNADINPDDEVYDDDLNYRMHMKKILKKRPRLAPVRLEVQHGLSEAVVEQLCENLNIGPNQVFSSKTPLDLSYTYGVADRRTKDVAGKLFYKPFVPEPSARFDLSRSMKEQIDEHDRWLIFPYESIDPFLHLLKEAASDPTVISIKITLYRLDHSSHLAEYLIAAAEEGKDVTVLMELRARFDEENNIEWAERFEEAGCNVLYGFEGYKVHSKICLITRSIDGEMHRIVQLSTGNYNEKTAKLYSDIMFMTADPHIGADAAAFFRNMQIGDLEGRYRWLLVAPVNLRDSLLGRVDEQIERVKAGKEARLVFKMNSLTDLQVIKKLVEASQAGVKINLIIRGICCLVPGIEGVTDNITVTSIVGRFLEHARIYCFLNGDDSTEIFLSSADLMTRNTEHRVEIGFPVRSTDMKRAILHFLGVQLSDNVKARVLQPDGTYRRYPQLPGRPAVECQQVFMDEATQAARVKRKEDDRSRKAHDERPGKVNR